MKFLLIGFLFQFLTVSVFSATVTSRIHAIEKGEKGEPYLIMMENGHTAFLDDQQKSKSLLESIKENYKNGETVEMKLDSELNVVSLKLIPYASELRSEPVTDKNELINYDPSIVTTEEASTAFKKMRRDYQNDSQCYNRAHIWTYEEFKRTGMRSGKLFLFFTSKYIRNYRYHWWFHVTPMAYVDGTAQSNWRTQDRRYTAGLLTTKAWTDVFMLNNATCPVVPKYSDYRNHQQSKDCYLIQTSMYFWQPWEISRLERTGFVKTKYNTSEINHAYWEAF